MQHLQNEAGASVYTQRNYQQALREFTDWHAEEHNAPPDWLTLQKLHFRAYLRFLGRGNYSRSAIQLRFSALRSFYKHLMRRGKLDASPVKSRCPKRKNACRNFSRPNKC